MIKHISKTFKADATPTFKKAIFTTTNPIKYALSPPQVAMDDNGDHVISTGNSQYGTYYSYLHIYKKGDSEPLVREMADISNSQYIHAVAIKNKMILASKTSGYNDHTIQKFNTNGASLDTAQFANYNASDIKLHLSANKKIYTTGKTYDQGNDAVIALQILDDKMNEILPLTLTSLQTDNFNYGSFIDSQDNLNLIAGKNDALKGRTIKEGNVAPHSISLSTTSINDNTRPGSEAATIYVKDFSLTDDTHKISLTTGSGDEHNHYFKIIGNKLIADRFIDFEEITSLKLRLKATDEANLSFEQAFTIKIKDIIEIDNQPFLYETLLIESNESGYSDYIPKVDVDDQGDYAIMFNSFNADTYYSNVRLQVHKPGGIKMDTTLEESVLVDMDFDVTLSPQGQITIAWKDF